MDNKDVIGTWMSDNPEEENSLFIYIRKGYYTYSDSGKWFKDMTPWIEEGLGSGKIQGYHRVDFKYYVKAVE